MYGHPLDFLEYTGVLHDTHADQLLCTPVLVEHVVGVLAELLHVRTDKHLSQLDEVTMIFVVDLDDTPGVRATAHLTAIRGLHEPIRAHDGEGNLARYLLRLGNGLLVLVLVRWCLKDVNVVVVDVGQYL